MVYEVIHHWSDGPNTHEECVYRSSCERFRRRYCMTLDFPELETLHFSPRLEPAWISGGKGEVRIAHCLFITTKEGENHAKC